METVAKRKRRAPGRHGRLLLLLALAAVLAAILLLSHELNAPEDSAAPIVISTSRAIYTRDPSEVAAITVQLPDGDGWTVRADETTDLFVLQGEDSFTLSQYTTDELRDAAYTMICEEVVSEDPAEYVDHLHDYGLDEPSRMATITFSDGTDVTLRIGSKPAHTTAWYYMTMDGDDCLYALGTGMVDALFVSRESLRDVTQPVIHKARIDCITLRGSDGAIQAQWKLQGDIGADDVLDRWQLTAPMTYPASADSMSSLLSNAANLRLGAYVCPATPENLTLYGFDEPRMTIELHMAAGTIGATNEEGAFTTEDWPAGSCTILIGGQRSDMVDYVLYEDAIYVSSHFTVGVFLSIDPRDTMTRYPVLTALGNLAALTITQGDTLTSYVITRTERVAENNELITDADGNVLYDVTITRNGEPFDYTAFEAAYESLITVRVSGVLPADDPTDAAHHTVYTFTDVDGTVHTVALHSYGVLHDAVAVDGVQAFYIEKGKFQLDLE